MLNQVKFRFAGQIAEKKAEKQQHNGATKPGFTSNTTELTRIYDSSKTDPKVLAGFRNNALSFGSGSGMGGMEIRVDPSSGFQLEDVMALLSLMNDNTKDLIIDLSKKLRPTKGFNGKDFVSIIKSILKSPEKEDLVHRLHENFVEDKGDSEYKFVQTTAAILESYNPADTNQKDIMELLLSCKDLNNSEDVLDILKETNPKTAPLFKKVLEKAKDNNYLNGIEVRLIATEIINSPEKEKILDKLLNKFFQPDNNRGDLSGILSILENYNVNNKAHEEMLDFYIDAKQNFWGLFISQLLEYTTPENKEQIKQIVNNTPGKGIDAASAILKGIQKIH